MATTDEKLFLWINGFVGQYSYLDNAIALVASDYLVPVSLTLSLIGLWFIGGDPDTRKRHQVGLFMSLTSMALSNLVVSLINIAYYKPRPFDNAELDVSLLFYQPTDSSFPANSIAASMGIAATVWTINRFIGSIMLLIVSLYAFSRIYVGIHYPFDIVAGVAIGGVMTLIVVRLRILIEPLPTWVIKAMRLICIA